MASDGRETEIKLPIAGVNEARRLLRAAGFRVSKRRVFEDNCVYDTAASDLRQSASLLRLRQVSKHFKLTYKGPPEPGKHKSRDEIETDIANGTAFTEILHRLGYLRVFRYEKFRTEFQRKGSKGIATLDETPVGVFLELEGDAPWIDRMARTLGYEEKDYITASYARLFFDWKERTGSSATDMLFNLGDKRARQ
jgi:adenylate cyclase class 2